MHDTCSTVHALALVSPFLSSLPLAENGLELVHPDAPLAHPLDDGSAVLLERSVEETARGLGRDAQAYRRLFDPLVRSSDNLMREILGPLRPPRHPLLMARFGSSALRSASGLAHSMLSLHRPASAAFGIVLALSAHRVGWPVVGGGSQRLADALASQLRSLGGRLETGHWVESLDELPGAGHHAGRRDPRQLLRLAGSRLPGGYARRLGRYRYGPGVFKLDWALDGLIPWRAPEVARAATVHIGGTLDEIAASEDAVTQGKHPNYVGGDINGGIQDLRQLFTRPVARPVPYSTPVERLYICSSSTPPGGGVHGMCGYWAARAGLRRTGRGAP